MVIRWFYSFCSYVEYLFALHGCSILHLTTVPLCLQFIFTNLMNILWFVRDSLWCFCTGLASNYYWYCFSQHIARLLCCLVYMPSSTIKSKADHPSQIWHLPCTTGSPIFSSTCITLGILVISPDLCQSLFFTNTLQYCLTVPVFYQPVLILSHHHSTNLVFFITILIQTCSTNCSEYS